MTTVLIAAAVLLLISVLASKASSRFGVPALLVFLAIGMLAGSEGPGGIYYNDVGAAQSIGILALAFILFSGGLDTRWKEVRPVLGAGFSLATLGVVISALLVGAFIHYVFGLPLLEGVLLGAIISSTDAAAVFSVLRSRSIRLRSRLTPLIELESGSNDPMAVFLTTALIHRLLNPGSPFLSFVGEFVIQMSIGTLAGLLIGRLAIWVINHVRLEHDGLYPVLSIATVLLTYGATDALGGNGFLAVYLAGLVLGNHRFIHRASLLRFHDGVAWLMQITMFLALGLLVYPSNLIPVAGMGLSIALALTFIARPVSVFIATAFSKFTARERLMISWAGLRGAVPIILATFPLMAQLPNGVLIFNAVFFTVLVSVVLQGSSIPLVSRWLGVAEQPDFRDADEDLPQRGDSELITIDVPAGSPAVERQIVELGLPSETLLLLAYRGEGFFAPNGSTIIRPGDKLIVLTNERSVDETRHILQGRGLSS
ncbi:MAG TPA: potassium/proton antiporter [Thermoanaerobaculia bacterium]|nr:potassium/proton antiporter [Thermoanaerobaculia bacterium]